MSGIRSLDCSKLTKNPKNDNDVTISQHDVIPEIVINSSLVLELWQFSFIRVWPEIRKSEFYPISGDWDELWIPNLARMSLIECYWMLQNSRATAFTVLELLRESQLGGVKLLSLLSSFCHYMIRNPVQIKPNSTMNVSAFHCYNQIKFNCCSVFIVVTFEIITETVWRN